MYGASAKVLAGRHDELLVGERRTAPATSSATYQVPPTMTARRASRAAVQHGQDTSPTAAMTVDAVVTTARGSRTSASAAWTPVTKPFCANARSYRPSHCMAATAASSRPPSTAR